MDQTTGNNREAWQQTSEQLRRTAANERRSSERLAGQLSREALNQFQRSIEGFLALPTAAALGIGSATLYAAAFLERGFEVLQQSTEALRNGIVESRRELERQDNDSGGSRLRERVEVPQNRMSQGNDNDGRRLRDRVEVPQNRMSEDSDNDERRMRDRLDVPQNRTGDAIA